MPTWNCSKSCRRSRWPRFCANKRILAIGAGLDHQQNFKAYTVDGQLSLPIAKNALNGILTLYSFDGGTTFSTLPQQKDVALQGEREGLGYEDFGPGEKSARRQLSRELQEDLAREAEREQDELQTAATKRLEGHLADLQKELNGAVNRVTAEALKQKAAQIGQIKEVTEDPQSGSLTIRVEV